jgi:hypothetical protein
MKEFLVYTAARFAVFAVCVLVAFGIFWLAAGGDDVPVLWPLLLGAILSVMVSAWLLRGLRDRFVARVQARAQRGVDAHRDAEGWGASEGAGRPIGSGQE